MTAGRPTNAPAPDRGGEANRSARDPEVSVVIPTHDRSDLLRLALRSALAQVDVALEVIIVDDGSTDKTMPDGLDDARIRVVRHDRAEGPSPSRNEGIALARGRWVAFLDDDDLWAPNKLASQLAVARASGRSWVYVGSVNISAGNRVVGGMPPIPPEDVMSQLPSSNVVPGGCSGVLVATDVVRAVGGFDVALSPMADWDLWLRLASRGVPACVDRPLVAYRVHAGNLSLDAEALVREFEIVSRRSGGASRAILYRYLGWWMQRSGRKTESVRYFVRGALLRSDEYRLRSFLSDVAYVAARAADPLRRRLGLRAGARTRATPPERAWREEAQTWIDAVVSARDVGQERC